VPDPTPPTIRPARTADRRELEQLRVIERRAGALFVDVGLPEIAADEPPDASELRAAEALLVAVDAHDEPVGYARVELVDGHAHLEQLSVDPASGRQGIGGRLLDAVASWAAARGDDQVTLTTFIDVPFNAPYYVERGFAVVPEPDRPPGLAAVVAAEAAHGLDPSRRVTMVRRVGPGGAGGTSG
jgi:GNAT superfamily N-acetyltransferase